MGRWLTLAVARWQCCGRLLLVTLLVAWAGACLPPQTADGTDYLGQARRAAAGSKDPERVGAWLLAELLAPGGDLKQAERSRRALAALNGRGVSFGLARAIDHDSHGRFREAAPAYLVALDALRDSARPDAALVAWFVANRLAALRGAVAKLWDAAEPVVERAIDSPGALGWRARGELVDWWSYQALMGATEPKGEALLNQVADRHGCLREAVLAGPFGHGVLNDHRVAFEAERPAPWPARFTADPRSGRIPEAVAVDRHACLLSPARSVGQGVYYVQSFIDLPATRDVIIAVQGAYALFVDDTQVMTRDRADWGVWPRFGVRLRLSAGRHRILARLIGSETSIRVLGPSGVPMGLAGSADQRMPYTVTPPERLGDPNVLEPFLRDLAVRPVPGAPVVPVDYDVDHPVTRYVGAYLAHVEGQDDLASVLMQPLVADTAKATALSLAQQALFADGDTIFPKGVARDRSRDLRQQAADRDPDLWGPQLWLALAGAKTSEPAEMVGQMEALAARFGQVPVVIKHLAAIYAQLGWPVEHGRTLALAAARFPQDVEVLSDLLKLYEARGQLAEADELARRISELDPTAEVRFRRALERRDYPGAIAALKRIGKLRKDRRDIAIRIADLLVRAGKRSESLAKLELALRKSPDDAGARLALADARFAAGDGQALTDALVEAIRTGSADGGLRAAIELVEGMTDLEPYRRDGLKVIQETEQSGVKLPGTAARVLDYAALWIAADGSARMLEHEIIRVQSRDGIDRHAEQEIPRGMVLRMRTIKSNGKIFEPEIVARKRTVTMPHLEVGDYIETESIWMLRPAGAGGRRFGSPRWFFREENTSYHLSEFVVISPTSRELIIETTGDVPKPTIEPGVGLSVRRWKVTASLALPSEPLSAPVQEFLPSVRVGWGVDLESQLRRLVDLQATDQPADPRLRTIARNIVAGKLSKPGAPRPKLTVDQRAKRIYRWVLDTVQPGSERSGARIITGKSGDRTQAFLFLCRLVGVDARLGLVRDRLSPPPRGPFSEAEMFNVPAVRIKTERGSRWLIVHDRFAPYGYLPSSLRGQPAVIIEPSKPVRSVTPPAFERETTSSEGGASGIVHRADVELRADGSAKVSLTQEYQGRYAIQLRTMLNKVPESRRKDVVEAKLLGLALPGGRVTDLDVPNLEQLDEPVKLSMVIEVPNLAHLARGELVFDVPFLGDLSQLVRLPERQTPLYISERLATRAHVELTIKLPKGAKVVTSLEPVTIKDPRLMVKVTDRLDGGRLIVDRQAAIPAARVQPKDYGAFKQLVLRGNEALGRTLRIRL
jgi:tetratricopeptide (TPR) repeat protein